MLARNLPNPEPKDNIILAQAIVLVIVMVLLAIVWITSVSRLDEYNRHMCVDVYGRNENCEVVK